MVMMKDCGYVNATQLCKDGGKRFDNWLRLEHAKDLLTTLQYDLEAVDITRGSMPAADFTCKDTAPQIRGVVCNCM